MSTKDRPPMTDERRRALADELRRRDPTLYEFARQCKLLMGGRVVYFRDDRDAFSFGEPGPPGVVCAAPLPNLSRRPK